MKITKGLIQGEKDAEHLRLLFWNRVVKNLKGIPKPLLEDEFGKIIESVDKSNATGDWIAKSKDIFAYGQLFKGMSMDGKTKKDAMVRLIACLICNQGMHNSLLYYEE